MSEGDKIALPGGGGENAGGGGGGGGGGWVTGVVKHASGCWKIDRGWCSRPKLYPSVD
eukprot:COSAG01_NODE_5738_length_4066_cov_8.679859_5_plen_58_part_01